MVHSEKCFLCKLKYLGSIPNSSTQQKPGLVTSICNPSAERQRQVGPWGLPASQPNLCGQLQTNEKPYLKKGEGVRKGGQHLMNDTQDCPRSHMHTHSTHTHKYIQSYRHVSILLYKIAKEGQLLMLGNTFISMIS